MNYDSSFHQNAAAASLKDKLSATKAIGMSSQIVDVFLGILEKNNELEDLNKFMLARFESYRSIEPNRSRILNGVNVSAKLAEYQSRVNVILHGRDSEKDMAPRPMLNFDAVDIRNVPLQVNTSTQEPHRPATSSPKSHRFHQYKPKK